MYFDHDIYSDARTRDGPSENFNTMNAFLVKTLI